MSEQNPFEPLKFPGNNPRESAAQDGGSPRELVLVKHGQRYTFRYAPGDEARLLAGIADLARDPDCPLDWFDAAVLSHQMGKNLGQQMERLRKAQ